MKKEKTKMNNNKKIIISLSILLAIFIIAFFIVIIYINNEKNTMQITMTNYYNQTNSVYTCYEISIYSYIDKTINVNDFTFNHNDEFICVSKIGFNNKEFSTNESLVINGKEENKMTLYIILENDEPNTIYYNRRPITLNNSINTK